jgi:hypothetical protein
MSQKAPAPGYSVYLIRRQRYRDSGRCMMPVAAADFQAAQYVKLHAAQEFEAVTFSVANDGDWPTIPSHTDLETDANYIFLHFEMGADIQQPLPDGLMRYWSSGTYWYGLQVPLGLVNGFNLGVTPWSTDPVSGEKIPGTSFQALMNNLPIQAPIGVPNQPPGLIQNDQ